MDWSDVFLILTAPIHCRDISPNLMKKQTHPDLDQILIPRLSAHVIEQLQTPKAQNPKTMMMKSTVSARNMST